LDHYSLDGNDDSGVTVGFLENVSAEGPDGLGRALCEGAQEFTIPEEEGPDALGYGEGEHPVRDIFENFSNQPITPQGQLLRMTFASASLDSHSVSLP